MQEQIYKTPLKKLSKFFEQSRDNWKKKYFQNKIELKRVTNRIYDLENRKSEWKNRAIKAEKELKDIDQNLSVVKKKISP